MGMMVQQIIRAYQESDNPEEPTADEVLSDS
jgi:hypothetical protein